MSCDAAEADNDKDDSEAALCCVDSKRLSAAEADDEEQPGHCLIYLTAWGLRHSLAVLDTYNLPS